jgi:UDP:flavonoid glycosyltransferase YjiC (YdhE family)
LARYLFAAQPAKGHPNPLLTMGLRMRKLGHEVVIATPHAPGLSAWVERYGLPHRPKRPTLLTPVLLLLQLLSGYAETFAASILFFGAMLQSARSFGKALAETSTDLVVSDFSLLGACLAAEKRGIPYAIVYHAGLSFRGPRIPPFASGLLIEPGARARAGIYRQLGDYLERRIDRNIARASAAKATARRAALSHDMRRPAASLGVAE